MLDYVPLGVPSSIEPSTFCYTISVRESAPNNSQVLESSSYPNTIQHKQIRMNELKLESTSSTSITQQTDKASEVGLES